MLSVRNQHCSLLADGLRIFKGEKFTKFSSRHSSVSASKMENVQNAKYRLTYCIRAYGVAVLGCRASESFQRFIFPFPPNFSFFPKKEFQLESQQQSGKTFVHLFHKANALSYTHIQKWPNLWTDCTVLISQTVNFPFFSTLFFRFGAQSLENRISIRITSLQAAHFNWTWKSKYCCEISIFTDHLKFNEISQQPLWLQAIYQKPFPFIFMFRPRNAYFCTENAVARRNTA